MLLIAFSLCDLGITLMFNYCVFVRFFRQTTPLFSIKWSKTTRKYTKLFQIRCRLWLSSCQRPVLNESCKATVVERKNGNVKLETTKRGGTAEEKTFSKRSHKPPSALLI